MYTIQDQNEIIHHGVHGQKIGIKGVQFHIPSEHFTGGKWCVKNLFFSLITISIGLAGVIIIKNLNLSDLKILRKESVLTEYFDERFNESCENHYKNKTEDIISGHYVSLEKNIVDNNTEDTYFLQKTGDGYSQRNNNKDVEKNISITDIKSNFAIVESLNVEDFIQAELKQADKEMKQYNFRDGLRIYGFLATNYPNSSAAIYGKIKALRFVSLTTGNNEILKALLAVCLQYLDLDELVPDEEYKMVSYICIAEMKSAEIFQLAINYNLQLIKRVDDDPISRLELAGTFFILKRYGDAKEITEENLKRWPNDGKSLAFYGQVFYQCNNFENAVHYFRLALETREKYIAIVEFYEILGTSLLMLNRTYEAREIFRRSVAKNGYPNEYQRPSSYIENLKAQPIWRKDETPYADILNILEYNWQQIRDEGLSALNYKGCYITENETLTNSGHWQEFYLITNGNELLENCQKVQFTCALIQKYLLKHTCYSGQIKFSLMYPGTHIKPHCGPHNTRLRVHLGLKVPNGAKMRIVEDERSWKEGKTLIFDDSFEHEVWHNGNDIRLILIVDLWHPQVTEEQKKTVENFP